jgi:predicted ATPase/DNA-binding CsgD family transcriptional regulator
VTRAEHELAPGRSTGSWTSLTSLVGRAHDAAELTRLLDDYRLVTITGPGGVGKTRLAIEAARGAEDQFPDGVWFIDLGAVADEAHVSAEVTSALGVHQDPSRPALEVLAEALASRRLLLVLDNCEHVLLAVADLCTALLKSADDVRVLATSREQLGVGGETRYRLSPLELPGSDEPGAVSQSPAGALFIERARQADPGFALTPEYAPLVARVVRWLDGIPLAIELAAARVEALGMAGLADRIDDALRLLTGKDVLAAGRHRSLAAVADWSYHLLDEPERQVFRQLAVFPGPFTLEAAEAVAGPDAGPIVLRLVDCSLLVPPRPGTDGRTRYTMLQTLRAYGLTRLRETGEERETKAALAAFAWSVAERADAGLQSTDGEPNAVRWLDAEDATLSRALDWALDHDPDGALRPATVLAPWLRLRGRLIEAKRWLSAAVAHSSPDDEIWAEAQFWLGLLSGDTGDSAAGNDHQTAAIEAYRDRAPSRVLVAVLASGRAVTRLNLHDIAGAEEDARRALALARELGDPAGELLALTSLSAATHYAGDATEALHCARQAQDLLPLDIPGHMSRWSHYVVAVVLTELGERDSGRRVCAAGLTLARQVDDPVFLAPLLVLMADIERQQGNLTGAGARLREAAGLASRIGLIHWLPELIGFYSVATGRPADAVTLWAAIAAYWKRRGIPNGPVFEARRVEYLQQIKQTLTPDQLREAEERGAALSIPAAIEVAIGAPSATGEEPAEPARGTLLSPRERELVTLVAQGHTNAEIAARLYISARTVTSHLDRIRNKTGYRRRADLTRLAIAESLV